MTTITRLALVTIALSVPACGSSSGTVRLTELHRLQSGDLDVVLLSEDGSLGHGRDTFVVEFRSRADGSLVDVGPVKISATMPMAGGAPMFASVELASADAPGRYNGTSDFGMAGTWRLSLAWDGPRGSGSVAFAPMVQ